MCEFGKYMVSDRNNLNIHSEIDKASVLFNHATSNKPKYNPYKKYD